MLHYAFRSIGIIFRVFANGPGSILYRIILKIRKIVLDAFLLKSQHYKVQIKDKWSNSVKGVEPSFYTLV